MVKYKEGKIVTGYVTGIEKYGIFVTLDEYYTGLIHISEISSKYVRDISKFVEIGETIRMKVLSVDEELHHISLSIKDIDYRVNRKRNTKIKETPMGFITLSQKLPVWVDEKMEEYENNDVK